MTRGKPGRSVTAFCQSASPGRSLKKSEKDVQADAAMAPTTGTERDRTAFRIPATYARRYGCLGGKDVGASGKRGERLGFVPVGFTGPRALMHTSWGVNEGTLCTKNFNERSCGKRRAEPEGRIARYIHLSLLARMDQWKAEDVGKLHRGPFHLLDVV
ncbi:kelch-like protein 31-like isoform X2 [Anopheles sinensis]|uniref:Kelch-like protein 31-like isoform X2 n=1 Tax=Anopheles sinensis TaxID=74873 RepID=A0A084WTR3_ANOSI|nr:kelch-like protein 31-like isoform X2 [Anopheles sinensis]